MKLHSKKPSELTHLPPFSVKHLDKLRADYQEVVKDLVWIPVQKKEKELQVPPVIVLALFFLPFLLTSLYRKKIRKE